MTLSSAVWTGGFLDWAGEESAQISAAVADEDDVLGCGQELGEFVFDRFGRDFVAGVEDEQILDAADDAPVAVFVFLALIAGVEPSAAQDGGGFFFAIPVAGENIRAADDEFVFFADLHFDAVDCGADVAGVNGAVGIVHRADAGGFGESVDLQDADAEHAEEVLCVGSERGGAADKCAEIWAEAFFDLGENQRAAEREPDSIESFWRFVEFALGGVTCALIERADDRRTFGDGVIDAAAHAFQQRRDVEKIVWFGEANFVGEFVEIGRERDDAVAQHEGERRNP